MAEGFERERLVSLLQRDALRTGTFTLASGRTSHYYVDGRKVTLSAEGAAVIGAGMLAALTERPEITAVGGLTMGADPIVGATLAAAGMGSRPALRGFLVRKEAKGHGTAQLVEGPLAPGETVAIVDDVATTGGSSLKAVDAVEALGCKVGARRRGARSPGRGGRGLRGAWIGVSVAGDDSRSRRRAVAARVLKPTGARPWRRACIGR